MRLFDQLIIREAEVFACRVVSYLLQRSPELREALVTAVNDKVPERWLRNDTHFSCTLEHPTDDPESGDGRIDLFVEIDNAALAFEAKLTAGLRPKQTRKYIPSLASVARKLADLRGMEVASILILLVPDGRKREAETALNASSIQTDTHQCILTWEELFEAWRAARAVDDVARFVLDELEHFVSAQTGRRKDFSRLLPLLHSPLALSQHQAHREFLAWLYPAFRSGLPYLNTRLTVPRKQADRTYLGYYFANVQIDGCWGWYGFVDPRFADDPSGLAPALVMGADFEIDGLDNKVFSRVRFTHAGFNAEALWWRIRFDRSGDDLNRWQQLLAPVRAAIAPPPSSETPAPLDQRS